MPEIQNNFNTKKLIRNFIIELIIYGVLVVGYFLIVLQFFNTFLLELFDDNLILYSVVALLLIIAQGVLLDYVTTFLVNQIKLGGVE